MNPTSRPSPVDEAIDALGGDSAVARMRGFKTAWAVSKWREKFPEKQTLWLAEATGWRWTPHQLCPEFYPHPDDGLPEELRGRQRPSPQSAESGGEGDANSAGAMEIAA